MTKKMAKVFTMALLCFALFLTGCANYRFDALSGGPEANAPVESNGGAVVKKGDYLYFVNGSYDASVANDYGTKETAQRGYIYRAELDGAGQVKADSVAMLSPKQVFTATDDLGIFIVGDRIYYTSPSTERDKRGNILSSYLDLFSVKLDGTDTKKIAYVTSNTFTSKWAEKDGKAYFFYIDSNESKVCSIDGDGNRITVAEDYTGTPILGDDGYVYFATQIEKPDQEDVEEDKREYESYYEIYRAPVDGGERECVISRDHAAVNNKYALTLTKVENGALYYTKTVETITTPYAFDLSSRKEVCISINNPTTVHKYLGFKDGRYQGILATYEGKFFFIQMNEDGTAVETQRQLMQNETLPGTVLRFDGDYMYYTDSSSVFRIQIQDESGYLTHTKKETVFESAINTSTLLPEIIGDYLYFSASSTDHPTYANYLYRQDKSYVITDDMTDEEKIDPEFLGQLTEADQETFDKEQEKLEEENK